MLGALNISITMTYNTDKIKIKIFLTLKLLSQLELLEQKYYRFSSLNNRHLLLTVLELENQSQGARRSGSCQGPVPSGWTAAVSVCTHVVMTPCGPVERGKRGRE